MFNISKYRALSLSQNQQKFFYWFVFLLLLGTLSLYISTKPLAPLPFPLAQSWIQKENEGREDSVIQPFNRKPYKT